MADLGKAQTEMYLSQKDARSIALAFRELAPQVRNLGGKLWGGKTQVFEAESDGAIAGLDAEPDFALNAFFPVTHAREARERAVGYTLKLAVWDEGEQRRVGISSQASRQVDRPQASRARQKLVRMLAETDDTLTLNVNPEGR